MDSLKVDRVMRFLAVRSYPSGKKSYVYLERAGRRRTVKVIASVGSLPIHNAREIARRMFIASLTETPQKQRYFGDVAEEYMEKYSSVRKKSSRADRSRLDCYILPVFKNLLIGSITRAQIEQFHNSVERKITANRCLSLMSGIFNKAIEWEYCEKNPASGIQKMREQSRERFASRDELPRVLAAIEKLPDIRQRVLFKLYLLTGARKSELLGLKWTQVTDDSIYIADTKSGKPHRIPLVPLARDLLDTLPKTGESVFGMKEIRRPWRKVQHMSGLKDLRIHDLRRTVGSLLAADGANQSLIGKILNHSSPASTKVYTRFHDADARAALGTMELLIQAA